MNKKDPMSSVSGQATEKVVATTGLTGSERRLPDYVADVSERTGIRSGSPLPLGTQERAGGINFANFSENYGIHENEQYRLYLMFNAGLGGSSV